MNTKRYITLFVISLFVWSCTPSIKYNSGDNSGPPTGNVNTTLKVLASNVLLGSANATTGSDVDTETVILAANVFYDSIQSGNEATSLTSGNVQSALDEGFVNVHNSIVGTWNVCNIGHMKTGQVEFKSDGTFEVLQGTYNAGGTFIQSAPSPTGAPAIDAGTSNLLYQTSTSAYTGTYRVYENAAIGFQYDHMSSNLGFYRAAIIINARPNKIVHFLLGHTHDLEVLTREGSDETSPCDSVQ